MSWLAAAQEAVTSNLPGPHESVERRVALIIGNDDYPGSARLQNARSDALLMQKALEGLNFKVTMVLDGDLRTMNEAIASFAEGLRSGDVALFYYAGHGVQVRDLNDNEANYLIPAGFAGQNEVDVRYGAVHAGMVLERTERAKAQFSIVILDACRDNPFRGFRSLSRGLAPMEPVSGSYIAFATGPGQKAVDGLFTRELTTRLAKTSPGTTLDQVFTQVRARVVAVSQGQQQRPYSVSSVERDWLPWGAAKIPETPRPVITPEMRKAAQDALENGIKLLIEGNYEEAVLRLDGAVALDPGNARAYLSRGLARGLLRKEDLEIQDYTEVIRLQPANFVGYMNRALAHKRNGDCVAALPDFGRVLGLAPDYGPAYRHRGLCQLSLGRAEQAEKDLETAVKLQSDDAEALQGLGLARIRTGKYELAVRSFDEALHVQPGSAQALLGRAEAQQKLGDPAAAEQSLQRARSLLSGVK